MNIIGLTGGIATGKSTVTKYFSTLCTPIIDADIINKKLLQPNNTGYVHVLKAFPNIPLLADSALDKNFLRRQIFNDIKQKKILENILHPLIKKEITETIKVLNARLKHNYCIVSVPLLIETNFNSLVKEIWVTDCTEETQIKRLTARDNISIREAKLIISHQLSRKKRLSFAHQVIPTEQYNDMKSFILNLHNNQIKLN